MHRNQGFLQRFELHRGSSRKCHGHKDVSSESKQNSNDDSGTATRVFRH